MEEMLGTRHIWGHGLSVLGALGVAMLFVCAPSARASTSIFTNTGSICTATAHCWEAGDFGVLVGLRDATPAWLASEVKFNNPTVNTDIGVGSTSKLTFNGNADRTWSGPIDFADALVGSPTAPCTGAGCAVPTGTTLQNGAATRKVTVTGGTAQAASQILEALTDMRDISAYYGSLGVQGGGSALGTTLGRTVTSIGTAGNGLQVYTATTVNTNNNLVINGDADDRIIINITGSATGTAPVRFNDHITLGAGGITADQVFFNILGTNTGAAGRHVMTAGNRNLSGVFYVAADSYNVSGTFNGRLIGGAGTGTDASIWGATFAVNAPADTHAPEPSTYALMAAGLGCIVYARRRKTRV
jgi:hypothetical protein